MGNTKTERPFIYIENHSVQLKTDLINIAKNKGLTLTAYLRTVIISARDAEPEHLKRPYKD